MVNFRPTGDRVLIRRAEAAEKVGSLYVASIDRDPPLRGTVVAVGPGRLTVEGVRVPMTLEPGMEVLFAKFAGEEITVEEEQYLVARESDVLGWIS